MLKIAVLISGGGSNLQSIIDNVNSGKINGNIEMVISDSENAYGIERAKKFDIKTYVLDKNKYGKNLCDEILKITKGNVDLIVLAGFLSILKGDILKEFKNRIINIHPSLIPSFCGKGMYGIKVHEAAIESGVKVSGCTVHFVNEKIDHGAILLQEVVPVYFEDTKESLQKRVLEKEHILLPKAISLISEGRVKIVDGHGKID
ncbi:phosphoribosylglycinamide formyltransferase [Clostridium frigidicarnis]|uniref:Phosphoribosylglycinamide formyltransferase n=1 Tax=Clostridium frigidicarnis TaxID=84698 RepID=A0A1I0XKE4_9CLOT|nr:phosphoribosylglycinamide formyltransferase [Clostridium frigidicarnis]SFB00688.1 formyltetrahydrofolate-dependent phosphoribosylglycinamide formyltransferase [Clostridium frigidicarnis]